MSAASLSDSLLDLNCSASNNSPAEDEASGGDGPADNRDHGASGSDPGNDSNENSRRRDAAGDGAVAGPSRQQHHQQHQPQRQPPIPMQLPLRTNIAANEECYREFCEQFQFENLQCCWICNGYYAPNFGEPVCGVCHAFVFSVPTHEGIKVQVTMLSDDEDSGNDEPPYNATDKDRAEEADDDDDDDDDDDADEQVDADEGEEDVDEVEEGVDDDDDRGDPAMELELPVANDVAAAAAVVVAAAAVPAEAAAAGVAMRAAAAAMRLNFGAVRAPPPDAPLNLIQYIDLLSQPHAGARTDNGIEALPVEVLLTIFKHLDDVSLWHVSKVCRRWRTILEANIPPSMWLRYVRERWPLFEQNSTTASARGGAASVQRNWFAVYSALMDSSFCRPCLVQMGLKTPLVGRITSFRFNRLRCDFRAIELDEIEGIAAQPLDKALSHWQATIVGPADSPYEDGKFFLYIVFPCQYPMQPPTVRFLTKIIHPNVSRHGDVGCDIIQHNWSLALTISKLLLSVQSLLTDPFAEICMEPQVGRLYAEDRPKFNALARSWTRKYAMLEMLA